MAQSQFSLLENMPPPPYSPQHPLISLPLPANHLQAELTTSNDIPLLPLTLSTTHGRSHNIDPRSLRSVRRALEDHQRSSCPSHWGKYRHGVLLPSSNSDGSNKASEWLCWVASLFAPPQDQVIDRPAPARGRSNFGGLSMVNGYGAY
ncbi:hypothetical protein I302_103554 [Kwoniella bestiolae CBS 10118]|uniref:Uncharacterized protein n=1 Tax=Kwoniella bestiolae CBS 10118 TaxID=1296100 RepID=A0A1B9G8P5_9TREE|nr:hypothetical protein I302_02256 [Kwoniella bestiolae CBS 10118]OCF27414.1 hypothetical protein I302_02256 [Kwoniella bestiolae CBS 10118]